MIIGIHGKKRSGKDTSADHLINTYGFQKLSFADPVRDALWALNPIIDCYQGVRRYRDVIEKFGYDDAKEFFPETRRLLKAMGTEVGRELIDDDIWVDLLSGKVESDTNYVLSDVRFENEAKFVLNHGGFVIRVVRPSTEAPDDHISEQPISDSLIDHTIYNDSSLGDLYGTLDHLIKKHI